MELDRKALGRSQLKPSVLGFGSTGLGNMYVEMPEQSAIDTLTAAYAAEIRYYDTTPLYGHGLSERRLGSGLRLLQTILPLEEAVIFQPDEMGKLVPVARVRSNPSESERSASC